MFNHQARWDRKLPSDTTLTPGEPIDVDCSIEAGRVEPRAFRWKGTSFPVQRVNFRWKDRKGREEVRLYSVSTPSGTYEIGFFTGGLSWRLLRLIAP